ncbi:hypothetical protein SASPL_120739 [Salvia splendens]|uniref:RING-type domain-containing protein n=1 Tax=Salvia splendens TaxID=180675 RepID=A0A8X8XUU8_SALSN|nr:hypothetical protein SASPL_120739 [Salvia splendens]
MEISSSEATNIDSASPSNGGGQILQFPSIRFLRSPISSLIEYSGLLRVRPEYRYSQALPLIPDRIAQNPEPVDGGDEASGSGSGNSGNSSNSGEVSIRIIGEQDRAASNGENVAGLGAEESAVGGDDVNRSAAGDVNSNREGSSYQRYDIQQAARWIEQILPFSLLLLVVFIRQHLQGFAVTIYSTAILLKSNDILRKQTALKGERRMSVLVGYLFFFMLHIFGIYWWHRKDDLFYPLLMIPPKAIPPFWHAIFVILVNDIMARQAAMAVKLVLLMYYKNGRGHNFRRQGQMLTLIEYALLLYRALLPTPVQSFFASLKALSRKEIHYGSVATSEQVNAAGDLCAICQEKMHAPILLRCKHIFCEDCVSEWFERERTCPLCRALVRPADLQSYGDGSTNLFFQLF